MTLDNLKLGYSGTKEGAKQLVNDAAKIDKSVKSNDLSYANLVKAIHAVQVKMGIYGTTQEEAEKTITGSLSMVKAAWGNLMPALIQGGDAFDQCIENLVYSFDKFSDNAMPALQKALGGIGRLIETMAPKIEKEFPKMVDELLPPLIKAATSIVKGLISALPSIIKTIAKEIPNIVEQLAQAIVEAFGGKMTINLKEQVGKVLPVIKGVIFSVLGLVAAFKTLKAVQSVTGVFSSVMGMFGKSKEAGASGGVVSTFRQLAKTKTSTILKGMGNMAIIIGGFTIIGAALMAIAPYMGKLSDTKSILKLVAVISVLGVVGAGLSFLAGIVGRIPAVAVVKGLANMAIILGGMSAIILAFGKLSEIPKFNEFIKTGGDTLANLFNQIGKIAGSLVGGIGEGITNSLPKIGENLSAFAESLRPMFNVIKGIDMAGVGAFFSGLAGFLGVLAADKVVSIFGGKLTFRAYQLV